MRIAIKKNKDLVKNILFESFVDVKIPNSIYFVVKQDNKRLLFLMEYMLNVTYTSGHIYISDNSKGCLIVLYPHDKKTTTWNIQLVFNTIGLDNVLKVLKREKQLEKHHLKELYIHPIIFDFQTKEVLEHYKNHKLPFITETTTPANIKFYKNLEFKVIKGTNELNYPFYFLQKNF